MGLKLTFAFEKETKNTYRYTESPPAGQTDAIVGTLYVQKGAIAREDGKAPAMILVDITPSKE